MSELARGIYRYWRDEVLQEVNEPWSLHSCAQGLQLRGRRQMAGTTLFEIEADYLAGRCVDLQLRWTAPARHLHYRLLDDQLQWRDTGEPAFRCEPLAEACALFPLLRVATGPLLRQLAATPGVLLVPDIRDPSSSAEFLRPLRSPRHARVLGSDGSITHYRYCGGEYGEAGSDWWLDAHALVRRYRWASPQGCWDVQLDQLWTAASFTGLC